MRIFTALISTLATAALVGCASQPPAQPVPSAQRGTQVQTAYVTDVRDVMVSGGQPSGVGTFVGSIIGGAIGSNIGSGTGRALATVGGAVAGGTAINQIQRSSITGTTITALTVRFTDGTLRTFNVDPRAVFRVGDRVTVTTSNGASSVTR